MKPDISIYKQTLSELNAAELLYIFRNKKSASFKTRGPNVRDYALNYIEKIFKYQKSYRCEAELNSIIDELSNLAMQYGSNEKESCEKISRLILKLKDSHPMALNNLAAFHIDRGEFEEALELLGKIMISAKTKEDEYFMSLVADNYYSCLDALDLREIIIEECQEKMAVFPEIKATLLKWLGIAKLRECQYDEAWFILLEAETLAQTDSELDNEIKLAMAEYRERTGDYEACKQYCHKILEQGNKKAEAYHQLGMAHLFSGESEEALKYFLESYKISPRDTGTQCAILDALYETGKLNTLTNTDNDEYFDELIRTGEGKRIIDGIIADQDERLRWENLQEQIDKLFSEGDKS